MQNKFLTYLSGAIVIIGINFYATTSLAETADEHDEHDDHVEITLSPEAAQNYGIKTAKVSGGMVTLPRGAFVASENQYFVYGVEKDGFVELVPIDARVSAEEGTFLNNQGVDEFVVEGAKYLRLVSLSQKSPIAGHVH